MAFTYDRELDKSSIRLLRLLPPQPPPLKPWDFSPEFTIEIFSIDNAPRYEALSYTWGPPEEGLPEYEEKDKSPILIDGKPFPVFPNLINALRETHRKWNYADGCQHFWIDAVCIDQSNLGERAAQVSIMDKIYSKADSTIIWLGQANEHDAEAVRIIGKILEIPREEISKMAARYPHIPMMESNQDLQRYGLPQLHDIDSWKPIFQFFSRRWFHRTWMIQELVLSTKAAVMWGDITIDWGILALAAFFLERASGVSRAEMDHRRREAELRGEKLDAYERIGRVATMTVLLTYCRGTAEELQQSICETSKSFTGACQLTASSILIMLAINHRQAGAVDLRDKVFSLLGVANFIADKVGVPGCLLMPSYGENITSSVVFEDIMSMVLSETGKLTMLAHLNDWTPRRMTDLPSWVIDFSSTRGSGWITTIQPPFAASGNTNPNLEADGHRSDKTFFVADHRLNVHGIDLGSVKVLGVTSRDIGTSHNHHLWLDQLLQQDLVYPFTGETRVEAFWRTLVMNVNNSKYPAEWDATAPGEMFNAWVSVSFSVSASRDGPEKAKNLAKGAKTLALNDTSGHMPAWKIDDSDLRPEAVVVDQFNNVPYFIYKEDSRMHRDGLLAKHDRFGSCLRAHMANRRFVISDKGHYALAPAGTDVEDRIVIVSGCPLPLIVRSSPQHTYDTIIGSAYIHGMMYGEAVNEHTQWRDMCFG